MSGTSSHLGVDGDEEESSKVKCVAQAVCSILVGKSCMGNNSPWLQDTEDAVARALAEEEGCWSGCSESEAQAHPEGAA